MDNKYEMYDPLADDYHDYKKLMDPPGNPDRKKIKEIQYQFTCICEKMQCYMWEGQISTCPNCGRQWKAVRNKRKCTMKFVHLNNWWRKIIYKIIK